MNENGSNQQLESHRKKLEDVIQMIFATVNVWDLIDWDGQMHGDTPLYPQQGQLTGDALLRHDGGRQGGGGRHHGGMGMHDDGLLTPDDAMYESAKTLGGQSMISQTSSAAMDQRKTFLKKASMNPQVRKPDRVVAAHLVQTFLTTKADTPHHEGGSALAAR